MGLAATAFAWGSDYAHELFRHALAVSPWLPLMLATLLATAVSRMICPRPLYKALADNYLLRVRPPNQMSGQRE